MDVGILLIFQSYRGRGSDADVMRDQMRLALLAEASRSMNLFAETVLPEIHRW